MIKHLIVQLDDTSVSFCHYENNKSICHLMPIEILQETLLWSMKENVALQILYPDYILPSEYWDILSQCYRTDIVSSSCKDIELRDNADVVVFNSWNDIKDFVFAENQACVVKTSFDNLFLNIDTIHAVLPGFSRLNVVITDIQNLDQDRLTRYSDFLQTLSNLIFKEYTTNHPVQVNILTDRMMLDSMNNCGAGDETITIAPNGKFYICPGFYLDETNDVGDINTGITIPNSQLYRLECAPICRTCDAWQCKRCVWQNKNFTLEVNTPGKEQCVVAHTERNASRSLLLVLQQAGIFSLQKTIPSISYLDPFDNIITSSKS